MRITARWDPRAPIMHDTFEIKGTRNVEIAPLQVMPNSLCASKDMSRKASETRIHAFA